MPAHFWCPLNIWNVTDWGLLKFLLSCDNYTEHYSNDTLCPVSRSVHRVSQNIILKYLRASVPCKLRDNLSTYCHIVNINQKSEDDKIAYKNAKQSCWGGGGDGT